MIISRHTNEEKKQCVDEYLNGADNYYLSGKYSVSTRTIDRWISGMKIDEVKLRLAKRSETIPIDIQEEILKVLNTNPIVQGFNISNWNEVMITKYIKNTYNIEINRRMAKALIEDSKKVDDIGYEDKIYNYIEELETLGYSIVLLDYIKIGRISSKEVELLELRKYTEDKLDVNLVIYRANDYIYLDVIASEISIVDKTNITVTRTQDKELVNKRKLQRKEIVNDKYRVLNKIIEAEENKDIVFITTYDKDINRLVRKRSDIKYFIVEDSLYNRLLQKNYEGEYGKSIDYYMNDENNRGKVYRSIRDISNAVKGKVDRYVLKVTMDKIKLEKGTENKEKNNQKTKTKVVKMRKCIKKLKNDFIHNI